MRDLLIATRNKGKYPEIVAGLKGLPFNFLSLNDVNAMYGFDVPETGLTFTENALLKAQGYGARANLLTIADDSGLEVDALNGKPGVKSARYAPGTDKDRYEKLLKELEDVPDERRTARFVSVIAIYDPMTFKTFRCEGVCGGSITHEPKGEHGFGYDPIFHADELGARFAELTMEKKISADHRGKALVKAREVLLKEFA